jgi:hypothetical protein
VVLGKAFPDYVRKFSDDLAVVRQHQIDAEKTASMDLPKPDQAIPGLPVMVKNLDDVRLSFDPLAVPTGELIGVMLEGRLTNGTWTAIKRYYRIEGAGHLCVSETEIAANRTTYFLYKKAVNTSIGGKPAISAIFIGDNDQRIEEVVWVSGGKFNKVSHVPDQESGRLGTAKTNPAISALTLAMQLY